MSHRSDSSSEANSTYNLSIVDKSVTLKFVNNKEPTILKGCVHYIFASLFCMSKREHLRNKEKYFLFHFESSSRS